MGEYVINFYCSEDEYQLIEDILAIGYGEIYHVSLDVGPPYGMLKVDPHTVEFLRLLRSGVKFDRVIIHDSAPSIGELAGLTQGGRRYLQKVKF